MGVLLSKLAQRGRREEAHGLRERVESHRDVLDHRRREGALEYVRAYLCRARLVTQVR